MQAITAHPFEAQVAHPDRREPGSTGISRLGSRPALELLERDLARNRKRKCLAAEAILRHELDDHILRLSEAQPAAKVLDVEQYPRLREELHLDERGRSFW